MNKQQLANKIWESANKMRSKIDANEYKDYILGFIFYKFLSDKEVKYLKSIGFTDDNIDQVKEEVSEYVKNTQKNIGYFISYDNLFSTWLSMGKDFDVANVRDALSAFSRLISDTHKNVFKGIFDTLQTGLSKLGNTSGAQTKAISDLLYLIKDIPMDSRQDYDVLGFVYEYLISNFAANAGKKAGEFYTPHEVSVLMSEIVADHLKHQEEIKIYDPCSGSGSLLINIGKSASKFAGSEDKIEFYAQELKQNTYNLTRMNLVMRGIIPDNICVRNGDTLKDDWPYFDESNPEETYTPLYVDAVVSNPPYSQQWDPDHKESDPRFNRYGVAPKGKADYAFLLHALYHIKPDGIMTIVLPHGVLFRGGEEGTIRKNLVENNNIDAIIGLPANIFFGTGIPTIIMMLKQKRDNTDVFIVDASKGYEKEGKNNKLRARDIKKIADAVTSRNTIDNFSKVVTRNEIRDNDYNLNIPRYVDSSEKSESWDIYASMFGGIPSSEIDEMSEYWEAFPELKSALFSDPDAEYTHFCVDNIKEAIVEHDNVHDFKASFDSAFSGFDSDLNHELLDGVEDVNISKGQDYIAKQIFERMSGIPLVDKYEAYQIFHDEWEKIEIDLEIIQTEGFAAVKVVDPNMVIKKRNNRDTEEQDGWIGHVIPFELVQNTMSRDAVESIHRKESRVNEISSEYDELLDELPEEEKSKDFVNDDGSSFVTAQVKKEIKSNGTEQSVLDILKKYIKLDTEKKILNKEIKEESAELQIQTKIKIESLSDDEAYELLRAKWILPIIEGIKKLPTGVVNEFATKLEALAKKYETTLSDIAQQINDTEFELAGMLDQLTGNEYDMKGLSEFKRLLGGEK
mgnify:CR=1 FL=1